MRDWQMILVECGDGNPEELRENVWEMVVFFSLHPVENGFRFR